LKSIIIGSNGMELGQSGAGRKKNGIIWAASLAAAVLITFFASTWYHSSPGNAGNGVEGKRRLITEMRRELARAAEKEKCAILALSDEESGNFADQSRASSVALDRDLDALRRMIGRNGSGKEREMLQKFETSWKNLHQIDSELLMLAAQNTDMKAIELSGTIGAELLQKLHEDLARISLRVTPPARRSETEKVAGQAEIAALNLAALQMRHIHAPSIDEKTAIEATMKSAEQNGNAALRVLDNLAGKKSNPFLRGATTEFSEFMQVNEEIVRLSRINSNNSSIEISLGRKLLADTECDRALKALQTAVVAGSN
jgi:hypothetical protein